MIMKTMKKVTYSVLAGLLTLLGLSACASKKSVQDERQQQTDADGQEKFEQYPGRMVVLYGGPNMRYREVKK